MSPRLGQHLPEPFVEVHPDDAAEVRRRRRRLCAGHDRLRAMHASRRRQRAPAARHAVRADPLERGQRDRRARRFAGGALSPIRSPASPRTRRRRHRSRLTNMCSAALRCRASRSNCPRMPGSARVAVNGGYGYLFADNADLAGWQSWLKSFARRRSRRIRGFRRRRLSRGVLWRRPHRDLPVHRARARRRRLECGQGPVRRGCARQRPAPHAAVGQIGRWPCQCRPDRLRLLRRRPQHHLRHHRGAARVRPRRSAPS